MVSLVLTTYNGEKYIAEQMDSIRNQTMQPDEVLIRDDVSKDHTVEIINRYIKEHDLKNWNIAVNPINYGWKKNYYHAISEAKGDLIILCDQDDIWHTDKIEKLVKTMNEIPDCELLVSGYHSFYEDEGADRLRDRGLYQSDERIVHIPFDKRCLTISFPGCTYCFRAELRKQFLEHWFPESPHDAMLWYLAIRAQKLYCLNEVLMEYRRHHDSAMNISAKTKATQSEICHRHIKALKMLKEIEIDSENNPEHLQLMDGMIDWYQIRLEMAVERKPGAIFRILPRLSYYTGIRQFLLDAKLWLVGDRF